MRKMKFKNIKKLFLLGFFAFGLCLTSCETEEINNEEVDAIENEEVNFITKYFQGEQVKVVKRPNGRNGQAYYSLGGGDMILTENQLSDSPDSYNPYPVPGENLTALATGYGVNLWSNNTVVYYISSSLPSNLKRMVESSISEWENKTNVRFKEYRGEQSYLYITYDSNMNGGEATLGEIPNYGGDMWLGPNSDELIVIHELGHSLGFEHEHQRADRDCCVNINWNNIDSQIGREQYEVLDFKTTYGTSFDVRSIMSYNGYEYSRNGRAVMTLRNGNDIPRQSPTLSAEDIKGTNKAYPNGTNTGNDPCAGVPAWSSGKRYSAGDKVTYFGTLYQRTSSGWQNLGSCN